MKNIIKKTFVFLLLIGYSPIKVMAAEIEWANPSAFCPYKNYNSLSEVEISQGRLEENGNLITFLEEAREIARINNVEDVLGFRLIHRHFSLQENEHMVEFCDTDSEGQKKLITRPETLPLPMDVFPASWLKTSEGWEVFEYSRDKEVQKSLEAFPGIFKIIEELYLLSTSYGLNNLLAPALLKRELEREPASSAIFIERSFIHPEKKSVVTLEEPSALEWPLDLMITTGWSLSEPITHRCVGQYICTPNFSNGKKISHIPQLVYHNPAG